jgi:hypothetical protein
MRGQSWNAGAFLLALHVLEQGPAVRLWPPRRTAGSGS